MLTRVFKETGHLVVLLAVAALSLAGCKQAEGERCQMDSDCDDGLQCCKVQGKPAVCKPTGKCGDTAADGGSTDGGKLDGGKSDGTSGKDVLVIDTAATADTTSTPDTTAKADTAATPDQATTLDSTAEADTASAD